jgi:hypothetical protein
MVSGASPATAVASQIRLGPVLETIARPMLDLKHCAIFREAAADYHCVAGIDRGTAMSLIKEVDFGTPSSLSTKLVTLTIDGKSVTVPEGTSVMRAAMH